MSTEDALAMSDLAWRYKEAIDDALVHYAIGQETMGGDLYVDWHYVAERMRDALVGAAGDEIDGAPAAGVRRLREALAFARSVIKSGEPWTPACAAIIDGALRKRDGA